MKMRPGEKLIDKMDAVEDTKGNNGERGPQSSTLLFLTFTCISNEFLSYMKANFQLIHLIYKSILTRLGRRKLRTWILYGN